MPLTPVVCAVALIVEMAAGYPAALFRAVGHPVTWIGALIARLDTAWNRAEVAARGEDVRRTISPLGLQMTTSAKRLLVQEDANEALAGASVPWPTQRRMAVLRATRNSMVR